MRPASNWLKTRARHKAGWRLTTRWMGQLSRARLPFRVSVSHRKVRSGSIVKSTCVTVLKIACTRVLPDVVVGHSLNQRQLLARMESTIKQMDCPSHTLSHASCLSQKLTWMTWMPRLTEREKWSIELPAAWRACSGTSRRHSRPLPFSRRLSMAKYEHSQQLHAY